MVMVLIMDSFMGLVGGLEGEPAKSQKSRFVSKFKSGSTHPTQGQLKITCIESISDVSNQLGSSLLYSGEYCRKLISAFSTMGSS